MATIFGEGKISWKLQRLHSLDTLWDKNLDEIALSGTVKEIEANLCFAIFGKNSKIQNGRHFWGGENFLKIAKSTFLIYPVGWKFRRNCSISHGLGDMSTFAFFSTQNSQLLIILGFIMADTSSKRQKIYIYCEISYIFTLYWAKVMFTLIYVLFNILQKPFPVASSGSCTPREKYSMPVTSI